MKPSRAVVRAGWLISHSVLRTTARHLVGGEQIEFEGELHSDLLEGGKLLNSLRGSSELIDQFLVAFSHPSVEATFGSTLCGSGWGTLFLELTGRCNERCVHCYASSSPDVDLALSESEILGVLDSAAGLGFRSVQLTGGDPLISPHLLVAVSHAFGRGFEKIEVYTNGLAFRESLAEHFADHGVRLAFSVYSHLPEVHDRVTRTPGSHVRTCQAIHLALAHGLEVRVAGIQGCDDEQDQEALLDFLLSLGIPRDRIFGERQRPVGRGKWAENYTALPGDRGVHSGERKTSRGKLSVSYSGNVVPCIFDRQTVLGSIRNLPLESILNQQLLVDPAVPKLLPTLGEPLACSDCRSRRDLLKGMTWGQT